MKIVVLSGAGISAESGIRTFRDSADGLWNEYKIEEVCTAQAWDLNPTLVNDFYNMRRINAMNAQPNLAHIALAEAQEEFDISIVTTNVDDLHERAGSNNVLHLHGNLLKARSSNPAYLWAGMSPDSSINNYKTYPVGREGLNMGSVADDGWPLRPDIVFFGESVPLIGEAAEIVKQADVLIVVGTSLNVYPAASLVWGVKKDCKVYYVDPTNDLDAALSFPCKHLKEKATVGIPLILRELKGE